MSLKQHPLLQPFLPHLRSIRSGVKTARQYPEFLGERKRSQAWSKRFNQKNYEAVEQALQNVKKHGGFFGGWAADEAALRAFAQYTLSTFEGPLIAEFGSGQSTRFWQYLHQEGVALQVNTFEHHPYWFETAQRNNPEIVLHQAALLFVDDEVKQKLFAHPENAERTFHEQGKPLPESEWDNTRTQNAFYDVDTSVFAHNAIQAVLLDGPNGSGRSLAFPLLKPYLAKDAIFLIDDYDHYPFLEELSLVFEYELLHVSHKLGKSWCLLQLQACS